MSFDLMVVRQRVKAIADSRIRFVKGSVDFASALKDGVKLTPVHFIVSGSYKDGANPFGTQIVAQERLHDFSVITVMSSVRDARGEATRDEINEFVDPMEAGLRGWVPGDGFDPIECNGGQVFEFKDGQLWWQSRFRTRNENRSND